MDRGGEPDRDAGRSMRPHRTDGISLTFGMIFLGAALLWLLSQMITLDAVAVGWLAVSGLFLLGGLGVAQVIARSARRREPGGR